MQLQLICEDPSQQFHLDELAARWQLSHSDESDFALVLTAERLELRKVDEPKLGAIFVDLIGGAVGHRRKQSNGGGICRKRTSHAALDRPWCGLRARLWHWSPETVGRIGRESLFALTLASRRQSSF